MNNKLIPFYRKLNSKQEGYTLLLDQQSEYVYKVEHKEVNPYKFWITWALILSLLRSVKGMEMHMNNVKSVLIVFMAMILSGFIGVYKYKEMYKAYREVYFTKDMIDYYMEKGRPLFKKEVITTVVIFIIFIVLAVLFLIYHLVIWLLFALLLFGLFTYCLCGIPLDRYKLYKR